MLKKIFAFLLCLSFINMTFLPVCAEQGEDIEKTQIINAEFKTELDVNKASKGQVVEFVSTEDYEYNDVMTIPRGTIFRGEVKKFKKGRWGFRRAKARIVINQIILPNGETYNVKASTKRGVLKGSAIGNIAKGVICGPCAIVVGTVGAVVMIVEAISIVGLIIVGPTSYLVGRTAGSMTHGVNCKKHQGDKIKLKLRKVKNAPVMTENTVESQTIEE